MSFSSSHNDSKQINSSVSSENSGTPLNTDAAVRTALPLKLRAIIAFTFFSMIFGAGNLIFPPFIGAQAGSKAFIGTLGFILSGVGLPVLGVWVVCRAGGFDAIGERVSKKFARYLGYIVLLTVGPFLAIPRTATTSLEIAIKPFTHSLNSQLVTFIYSAIFFICAFILAQHPEKLSGKLGKITGPILVLMIVVFFVLVLLRPQLPARPPVGTYSSHQFFQGFLDGYQTMDLIAAMYLGIVVSSNVRVFGVSGKHVHKEVAIGGVVTGIFLILIYSALSYLGVYSESIVAINPKTQTGANVLTNLTNSVLGTPGLILIGLIFVVACFNVCTGLIALCATYFSERCTHIGSMSLSYRAWAVFFAFVSFAIANAGLSAIIRFAVPILLAIYPVCIVLLLLTMLEKLFAQHSQRVFQWSVTVTAILGIMNCVEAFAEIFGNHVPFISSVLNYLPWHTINLDWIIPAIIAAVMGYLYSMMRQCKVSPVPHNLEESVAK